MICTAPLPTPYHLGPTWERHPTEDRFLLPEDVGYRTLGWQLIGWTAKNLLHEGEPWRFTLEQMRFLLWMYAIDDQGRFVYRDIVLQRMKGWGKDPLAAVIAAIEFVGPCRLDRWATAEDVEAGDARNVGDPIGVQEMDAWVQIVAVSKDQTKNTMAFMASIFTKKCISDYGIDIGKEIIYADSGERRIEVTSSSYRSMEGNRPTFVIRNETHHWVAGVEGHRLHKVIRRNLAKHKRGQARGMSITNSYEPGEDSVAERQRMAYMSQMEGRAIGTRVLYDSLEAPQGSTLFPSYTGWDESGAEVVQLQDDGRTPIPPSEEVVREHLRRILQVVRGDAIWLDIDRLIEEILDPDTSIEESKRFYFNSVALGDDASFDPTDIAATAHEDVVAQRRVDAGDPLRVGWSIVRADEPVVIFGDGSKSNDSTALIGCRVSDGYLFTLGVWQKPPGSRGRNWLAPRAQIDARVHEAIGSRNGDEFTQGRFNVVAFFFDPSHTKDDTDATRYWDTLIDAWHVEYGDRLQYWAVQGGDRRSAIGWDMTSPTRQVDFVQAVERFTDEMEFHSFRHDGHPALVDHLTNARRSMTSHGLSVSKVSRGSKRKIDAAVCAIGARMLRRLVMVKGLEEVKKPARVWW